MYPTDGPLSDRAAWINVRVFTNECWQKENTSKPQTTTTNPHTTLLTPKIRLVCLHVYLEQTREDNFLQFKELFRDEDLVCTSVRFSLTAQRTG